MSNVTSTLPVAVIGAGPVGLAAAAHLLARGLTPIVLEAGSAPGTNLRTYTHVQLFSPWRYNVDKAAKALLEEMGWKHPPPTTLPTAGEIVRSYLEPLAVHPAASPF
jgi:cation diffusion facilitator CzcD-associated flavoprotein CzcO